MPGALRCGEPRGSEDTSERRDLGNGAERGVVAEQPAGRDARKPFFLLAFTALAAITVVVSAALLATGEPKVSLVKSRIGPPPSSHIVASASAAAPIEWVLLLLLAVIALAFAGWLWTSWSRSRARTAPA